MGEACMATIRKLQSKKFLAEVRKSGRYKSRTFDTKVQAMAWAVETEQNFSSDTLVLGKTLGDLFERYRDEISPKKKSWRTEYNRLNKFMRHSLAAVLLVEIRQTHFDGWIQESLASIKSSSVNRDLNLLSSVFKQGKRWERTDNNPIRGIHRPKNPRPRDRRISEKEIRHIKKALFFDGYTVTEQRHEIAVAFLFAIETALRQGEIWGLRWEDISLERRFLTLHETKNGTKRDVPLSKEAVRLLKLLDPDEDKVFTSDQQSSATIFRRCLKPAGIKGLTFHDTRYAEFGIRIMHGDNLSTCSRTFLTKWMTYWRNTS